MTRIRTLVWGVFSLWASGCGPHQPDQSLEASARGSGPAVLTQDPFAEPAASLSAAASGASQSGPRASAPNGVRMLDALALLSGGTADGLPLDAMGSVRAPTPLPGERVVETRAGSVAFGPLSVTGPLPLAVVARIWRVNYPDLADCYAHSKAEPGTLELSFLISRSGDVEQPKVKPLGLRDPALTKCFVDKVKKASFASAEQPSSVMQTVTLGAPKHFRRNDSCQVNPVNRAFGRFCRRGHESFTSCLRHSVDLRGLRPLRGLSPLRFCSLHPPSAE